MTKLKKGDLEIDSSVPSEIVNLKAQGFRVVKPATVVQDVPAAVEAPKPGTPRK